jgi:hypothetical protein
MSAPLKPQVSTRDRVLEPHRLRRLEPTEPGLRELQALVRQRDDHLRTRTAAINQLVATLEAHWPGPRDLFCSLASPIALAFLTDYPTPQAARSTFVRIGL